jgi:hypothetical protein
MNTLNFELDLPANSDLTRVIEPLASYICAADRPRETLRSALAVLFNEVKETNRAALMHFSGLRAHSLELVS